ncbi:MazG-like family protein [Streptomyces sp. YIM S03343]
MSDQHDIDDDVHAIHALNNDIDAAEPTDLWTTVDALWRWLEVSRASDGTHEGASGTREALLLRMLKLSEEVGEAAQAVIGATGQNPRKGVTHSWEDVEAELCDVVITALVALRTLTPDTREVFMGHLAKVAARSVTPPRGSAHERPACAGG